MKKMEKLTYFPGCTLKDTASDFEISGMAVMEALGYVLEELERWNCCGTVFSLTDDDLMHQIAPVRDLLRAQEAGSDDIIALCSMCYATLKRTSLFVNGNQERLDKINSFMNKEVDYEGKVSVHHLLEVIRDRIGWEKIEERVTNPLEGLSVAPFYGCTLLRPEEIAIDDPDAPTVLQDLTTALWATPIDYAYCVECGGAYQVVDHRDVVVERTHRIMSAARRAGAD
ncbi:MAG TPA: heterodisulfide reductase, subunit B, partial [Candidatus Acetothermia bacterium]|nr:heterodisulfide reductase, subunit B [Candidatus Acetothermia bacterium]HEX32707.1 heterodisulfide reductase, subunit B [Candidatus Acetothermia bacterium]